MATSSNSLPKLSRIPGFRSCARFGAALVVAVLASACSPGSSGSDSAENESADSQALAQEAANQPPTVESLEVRATLGESVSATVKASDPDGSVVDLTWSSRPPGLSLGSEGAFDWRPPVAGTWHAVITATDDQGATGTAVAVFKARYQAQPNTLVGMGDSVAAGFGLDLLAFNPLEALEMVEALSMEALSSDALGSAGVPAEALPVNCWRSASRSYPALVSEKLVALGHIGEADAELLLVACTAAATVDLWEQPVPPPRSADAEAESWSLTQLDWAVRANPGWVTLTVGANDIGVTDFRDLLLTDGSVDTEVLAGRAEDVTVGLDYILGKLTADTDAQIVVTTYHNPVAVVPSGYGDCTGECFAEFAAAVHAALNEALETAVAAQEAAAEGRIHLVDIAAAFDGHEAPNALGPDWLRAAIETAIGVQVRAYCSSEEPEDSWVSSLDCIHPNVAGTEAVADLIVDSLR